MGRNKSPDNPFLVEGEKDPFLVARNSSLVCISLAGFIISVDFALFLPTLYPNLQSHGKNTLYFGWVLAGMAIARIITSIPFGAFQDKLGTRGPLLFGILCCFFGNIIYAVAQDGQKILLGRFISALNGGNTAVCLGYISHVTTLDKRAEMIGKFWLVTVAGYCIGPLIQVPFSLIEFGPFTEYRTPGFFLAALALALFIYLFATFVDVSHQFSQRYQRLEEPLLARDESDEEMEEGEEEVIAAVSEPPRSVFDSLSPDEFLAMDSALVASNEGLLHTGRRHLSAIVCVYIFLQFLYGYLFLSYLTFIVPELDRLGWESVHFALFLAGVGLIILVATATTAVAMQRGVSELGTLVAGSLCMALGLALSVLPLSDYATLFLTGTFFAFGYSVTPVLVPALITKLDLSVNKGFLMGIQEAVQSFARILAPLATSFLLHHLGKDTTELEMFFVACGSLVVLLLFAAPTRKMMGRAQNAEIRRIQNILATEEETQSAWRTDI